MPRYACAWCTAETVDSSPPGACVVCGEVGEFLFVDVPDDRRSGVLHALSAALERWSVSSYAVARSALRPPPR